jgi:DNA polymerase-3 subunit alpha
LCGYTLGQADMLRRIIGRKQVEQIEAAIDEMLVRGEENGVDRHTMQQICDQIVTFANYGFNQGHSTAYGYIAYQTAYLKAHYPVEFMCSLINMKATEEVPGQVEECKRLGIKILPPDIRVNNQDWVMEDRNIRIGLTYIKYVGHNQVTYCDNFYNFKNTNTCNKRVLEFLIKSGALDCYGNRSENLKELYKIEEVISELNQKIITLNDKVKSITAEIDNTKNTKTKKYQTLLGQLDNREMDIVKAKQKIKEMMALKVSLDLYDEVNGEIEALGFSLQDKFSYYNFSLAKPYNERLIKPQIIGGEIIKYKEIKTRFGKQMAFVGIHTIDDKVIEFPVFEDVLKKQTLGVGRVYLFAIDTNKGKPKIADVRIPKRI